MLLLKVRCPHSLMLLLVPEDLIRIAPLGRDSRGMGWGSSSDGEAFLNVSDGGRPEQIKVVGSACEIPNVN